MFAKALPPELYLVRMIANTDFTRELLICPVFIEHFAPDRSNKKASARASGALMKCIAIN
jgi:hypothetical protein